MSSAYHGFLLMLGYFTVLPVRIPDDSSDGSSTEAFGWMLFWLPLGGLILGTIAVVIDFALRPLGNTAHFIAAVGYMMLYGFLHTEALMDVVDALYAKFSGKDAYRIIKEPHIGALGALWTIGIVSIKVVAVSYLLGHQAVTIFLTTTLLSRTVLLYLIQARSFRSSSIKAMQRTFTPTRFRFAFAYTVIVGIVLAKAYFVALFVVGALGGVWIAARIAKTLGFYNGDVLGATLEINETMLLITGALLWH